MTKKKNEAKAERRGRPRLKFTKALADRICREVSLGKSLNRVLKAKGMPRMATVVNWLQDRPDFVGMYMRARKLGIQVHVDGLIDLSDQATEKNANAVRLRIETRKWIAVKLLPRVYGDLADHERAEELVQVESMKLYDVARRMAFVLWVGNREAPQAQLALPAPRPPEFDITPGIRPKDDE